MGSFPGWEISSGGCCCSTVAKSCLTLCNPKNCSTPGFSVLHYLPEVAQTHVHWVRGAIQLSHPLSPLLLLPSIFPSIRVFSSESALHIRGPKYWSFSFSNNPSNEYSGLISFRSEWFVLLAAQGTLKSLFQCQNWKASVLCIRWPKYWNFSTSPSNECSGLISFRIDWFDILYISP